MTDDSQENSLIRFGRAMKQVKGLWSLGCGLIMAVVWTCLCWRIWSEWGAPLPNFFLMVLYALKAAVWPVAVRPTISIFSLYSITMFVLIAIGLFRLVCSLLPTRDKEEEE